MEMRLVLIVLTLTTIGAFFAGSEVAIIQHRMDRELANTKLQKCHAIIAGEMFLKEE